MNPIIRAPSGRPADGTYTATVLDVVEVYGSACSHEIGRILVREYARREGGRSLGTHYGDKANPYCNSLARRGLVVKTDRFCECEDAQATGIRARVWASTCKSPDPV